MEAATGTRLVGYNAAMSLALLLLALFAASPAESPLDQVEKALQEKRWTEALDALERLRVRDPQLYQLNELPYLEGVIQWEAGNSSSAERIFSHLLERDFSFSDGVLLHLLRIREKQPFERREPLYRDFLSKYSAHPAWNATQFQYASALESVGRLAEAKAEYDKLWRGQNRFWSRKAALGHALLHVRAGENEEALTDLRKLLVKSEADDVAFAAAGEIHRLLPVRRTGEILARRLARTFINNRQAETARLYLRRLLDDFPRSLSADQYGYLLGRSYAIEGAHGKAVAAYADNHRRHPNSTWGIYSKYLTANSALQVRDYPTAERTYREVIRDHPQSKYAGRAYYNLADCYLWMGMPEKATRTLSEGIRMVPAERRAFTYHLARFHLERADWRAALEQLEALQDLSSARLPSGVTREEVHYWKGFCLEKLDRHDEATAAFRESASGRDNYFAYLSRFRNGTANPGVSEPGPDWSDRLLRPRPFWSSVEEKEEFLRADPAARVRSLLFLRLYGEASREIERTPATAFPGGSVDQLLNLAYWADRGRLPAESISAAERLQRAAFDGVSLEQVPNLVRSLLYPRHYWESVRKFGERHGVEPELILSVIRQESRFRPDALSPAAARGLMQFTRSTARQLASELKLQEPKDADLYRPELSVQLGAYYLSKLIKDFDGSVEKALAAYNGGADNVQRWSAKLTSPETPLFVANIGYRETKLYVLRVMGDYFAYRQIYGDPANRRAEGVSGDGPQPGR